MEQAGSTIGAGSARPTGMDRDVFLTFFHFLLAFDYKFKRDRQKRAFVTDCGY